MSGDDHPDEQDASKQRAGAAGEPEEPAEAVESPGPAPFGQPGRPLNRSPFAVAFIAGLGLILAYGAFLAVLSARSILLLVLISLFLAVGLNPAVMRLRSFGLSHGLAVAAVAVGALTLVCGGVLALVPPTVNEGSQLIDKLPGYIDSLRGNQALRRLNEQFNVLDRLKAAATPRNITGALGGVLGGAQLLFGALFNVLTVSLLTVYFMAAFDRLKAGAYRLVPASRRHRVQLITDEILTKVGAYMIGALTIAVIAGASTFVMLFIAGVAYPYALAVVVAVTDLIPQIGATLGAVLVSTVGFITSVPVGITCVVFFIVYQQVENWLIYPHVMRRAVKVSELAAVVGALLGFSLLGMVGALITIPAVAAVQLVFREVVVPRQDRH